MVHKAVVMAIVSAMDTPKNRARPKPDIAKTILKHTPILNSVMRKGFWFRPFNVPNANSRITISPKDSRKAQGNHRKRVCVSFEINKRIFIQI